MRSPLTVLVFAIAVPVAMSGCGNSDSSARPAKSAAKPVPVLTAKVEQKTVPLRLRAVGNVETLATVAIKSRVDGQIVKVGFKDGDDVEKGQLLFQIDPRPFEAQLQQAQANLLKDKAQLEYARGQEARYQDLLTKNFVSKEAFAQVRSNLEAAQASAAADEAAIESAKLQLQYATIRAPISGRVGKVLVSEGNLVKANDTPPLVVINQIAPIYVAFAVPEQYGPEIRAAMARGPMEVTAAPPGASGAAIRGTLTFVDNTVDPTTGTLKLRALFPNQAHQLWPGDFVETALTLREDPNAIVVPPAAVLNGPKGTYAFVVKPDRTVEQRPIQVARSEGDIAVIGKGLAAGETVVVDGASRLVAGSQVSAKGPGQSEGAGAGGGSAANPGEPPGAKVQ
jgi:multidrug efflux system membrane fusion protein